MLKKTRVVIKIGSSSVVNEDFSINKKNINSLLKNIKELREMGIDTALVTSGAIACGRSELNIRKKTSNMALRQALAAVGQAKLIMEYNTIGSIYGIKAGQILVNHDDFQFKHRMKCLSDTLNEMFKNNVLPVINENDALAVEEIKLGDNDTLSSLIAPLIKADLIVLLSDIDGLYNKDPNRYSDATLIKKVTRIDESIFSLAEDSISDVGTGGMSTKISSALYANKKGIDLIICNNTEINRLKDIVINKDVGTLFTNKNN